MRFVKCALVAGLLVAAGAAASFADDVDQATLAKVMAVAAKGYANPTAAKIRNVRKSLATSGSGYCGEITVEASEDTYTVFHVLLETPSGPSVLRLVDFDAPDTDPKAATVHEFFVHVGCITE
jgi:predicted lipoprotein